MAKKKVFDKNILIIVGFILLIALVVVVFKVATRKKNTCPDVKFQVTETSPMAGSPVTFLDQTEGAVKWDWDFGDSTAHATTSNPSHTYAEAKDYLVTLTVNEGCQQTIHVLVASQYIPVDTNLPTGKISGPSIIEVGKEAVFKDESGVAKNWEWSFAESGRTDATTQAAKYTFLKAGPHKVTLNIDSGKCKTAYLMVNVITVTHEGPKPNPNQIDEATFVKMMNDLHNPDKSYMMFDKYLDGNTNMVITVNGKKILFSSYCKGLSLDTRYSVKSAVLTKDARGYIKEINITEEKSAH